MFGRIEGPAHARSPWPTAYVVDVQTEERPHTGLRYGMISCRLSDRLGRGLYWTRLQEPQDWPQNDGDVFASPVVTFAHQLYTRGMREVNLVCE